MAFKYILTAGTVVYLVYFSIYLILIRYQLNITSDVYSTALSQNKCVTIASYVADYESENYPVFTT